MKFLAGIVALALSAAGCSAVTPRHATWHSGWTKPGLTGEVFEQDVRACDRAAIRVGIGQPGLHGSSVTAGGTTPNPAQLSLEADEHQKRYAECMKSKGYTSTKS